MATITLNVLGSTVGALTAETVLDQAQSDRLMAFLAANYGAHTVDGVDVARTPQEMVDAYWAAIVRGTLNNVIAWEKERDARAASNAVAPMSATLNGVQV